MHKRTRTCLWRIVISPSHMACNIATSLFFMSLISKALLILARHRFMAHYTLPPDVIRPPAASALRMACSRRS